MKKKKFIESKKKKRGKERMESDGEKLQQRE